MEDEELDLEAFEKFRKETKSFDFSCASNETPLGKVVKLCVDVYSPTWEKIKSDLNAKTHQQAFNRLISEVLGWDESELVQKDYGPRRNRRLKSEITIEETMARPKKDPTQKKRSLSISVTEEELKLVQGSFKNFATGAIFLSNLMTRLYEEGVIPDHVIAEEMEKMQ